MTPKRRLQRNGAALDFEALEARLETLLVAGGATPGVSERRDMASASASGRIAWWQKWLTRLGVVAFLMRHPGLYHPARRLYHRLRR
ncbi:MAG: hypothetical protein ACQER5_00205 [Pseudomonadota bacterium]